MKQFLGPGGEKEAKVKVREETRESLKRVELRGETGGQWTCTGDLRYDESRGPVFPGQGVVAPPGVWETRYCMWLQGREPSGSSTTFQTTPIFRRPLGPVKWVLT